MYTIIYENDKVWGDYLKCDYCDARVERGIINVSQHWKDCTKRPKELGDVLYEWSLTKPEDAKALIKLIKLTQ